MLELGGGAGFALEALDELLVEREREGEDLDGDVALELAFARLEDDRHAAAAELVEDFVLLFELLPNHVDFGQLLLAGLDGTRDRAIFLIACFCALRPSELFGLTWGCCTSNMFTIVNTAWRGRLQRKKIKRKNRYGRTNCRFVAIPQAVRQAIDLWRARCPNPDANALMFPGMQARARKALATPIHPDNWLRLRLYPVAKQLGIPFHPTFQVLRRSFSTHGKHEAHPTEMQAQLGHSDIRTTLDIYTQIADPEVARMVNQVANRILGLGEEVEPGSVQ